MASFLSDAPAAINRFVDWFIPAELVGDREMVKQARMFLISHLFGPFIGNVVPLTLWLLDPAAGMPMVVLAASITGFWIFPFVLKRFGHYYVLALISIQNLIFCILWSCYFYGGVTSPTLPWVLTIPLLAFFYLGSAPRLRLVVLGMFALNFAAFYGFSRVLGAPANGMPFAAIQGLGLVSTTAASLYVTMMALFYARALASQGELEVEMREHLATATELRRATREAERAGAAKADFLAKMSHELRTPLNAVIGYSQILLEDAAEEGDEETASDLQKIHGAGQHLLRLVNEVLDLIKIDSGKMELHNESTDLRGTIDSIVSELAPLAKNNGNDIVVEATPMAPIVCDGAKLRQAIMQIADNAVKFTRDGRVTLGLKASSERPGFIDISVRDTGIGIAEADLPGLFEKFNVLNDASSSKYGGTGLGLALSRKLCLLMGGDVSVESRRGEGSCFTLHIPVSPPQVQPVQGGDSLDGGAENASEDASLSLGGAFVFDKSPRGTIQNAAVACHG